MCGAVMCGDVMCCVVMCCVVLCCTNPTAQIEIYDSLGGECAYSTRTV